MEDHEEKTGPMQWEDHCIYLVCSLAELYKKSEFIDCELDTEGGLLEGHRAILAACSPYLKELLLENEGRRIVPLKQVKYKDMKYILDFIYYGEVGVPVAGMASLMETANFLKISSLRSCLSPNAFRKILSEVPAEQIIRRSGSKNNLDLLTNYEQNSPILENRKMCYKTLHSERDDDLQTVSESEKKTTEYLEQISLRVNDLEIEGNIPQMKVAEKDLIDKNTDNSQHVSHSTSYSPLSPVSVKIEEDDNLNDISDPDDPTMYAEEHSYCRDEATEKGVEEVERNYFNKVSKVLFNSASPPEKVLILKKSCTEEINTFGVLEAPSDASSLQPSRPDKDISCPSTSTTNPGNENISINNTTGKLYLCGVCESTFGSKSALNRHMGIHTGEKPYPCDVCGKTFRMKRYLTAHMSFHTGEKPYVCSFCQAACRTKGRLNIHMRSHTGEKPYSCTMCGKSYTVKHHLARHIRIHTGEKPYQCNYCSKSFRDYAPLIIHKRTHTGERPFVCGTCGKAFAQKNSLNTHKLIHSDEKNHACSTCNKSFKTKVQLHNHMLTHGGKKSFLCSTCGKAFLQKGTLNIHMQIHTGVKSYLCSICGKSFLVPHQLKRHMQTHTGDKPHPCCICEKFFSDKGNLKAHMAIHTGAKHYRCCICDESFNRRSELKKHVVIHAQEGVTK